MCPCLLLELLTFFKEVLDLVEQVKFYQVKGGSKRFLSVCYQKTVTKMRMLDSLNYA